MTRGYQQAGFHVTGVDLEVSKQYPGDDFHRGDAVEFILEHGHEFDAVSASPPCQIHCALAHLATPGKHKDLIPQTRAALISTGRPWVMENVPGSTLNAAIMLCGSMFRLATPCGVELRRHRYFEINWALPALLPCCDHGWSARTNCAVVSVHGGKARDRRRTIGSTPQNHGGKETFPVADARIAMGIDWPMPMTELSQAIPPPYAKLIGGFLMEILSEN
jgi:DNA (cytosine-5)-methyltransferase 1